MRMRIFPLIFVFMTCLFFFGFVTLLAFSPEPEVAIVIGMIMVPPGLFLFLVGITMTMQFVAVDGATNPPRVSFRLPKAGSAPLAPMMLNYRTMNANAISRVDVVLRPNSAAVGGCERLYHLRTNDGDYYFNSVWFSNWILFDEFLVRQEIETRVGSPDEIMDAVDIANEKRSLLESEMRGCGRVMKWVLVFIAFTGLTVALFGNAGDRRGGLIAVAIATSALGVVPMIRNYRRLK